MFLELVRHVMRQEGLVACQPRPFRVTTEADARAAANMLDLVKRDFTADRPGVKFSGLEHPVIVRRLGRDHLQRIPVFDDPAFLVKAEDVDTRVILVRPHLMAVQYDEFAVCEYSLELDALARVVSCHLVEVVNESLLAVADVGVVLPVLLAAVAFDGFARLATVEHEVVKSDDVGFVAFSGLVCHTLANVAGSGIIPLKAAQSLVHTDARFR